MLVRQDFDRKSGEYLIIASFAPSLGKRCISVLSNKVSWHFWKDQELKVALKTISDQIWIVFTICFHKQSHCLQSNCVGCNLWADINQSTRIQSSGFTSELQSAWLCCFPWAAQAYSSNTNFLRLLCPAYCLCFCTLFFFSFFFFFSSFSFSFSFPFSLSVVYFILVFIFKRKWEEGSKYLQTVLVYTMTTAHSVFHSDVWFGHIIEQSLTLSPGELRESTKSGKTLLISLQQNWRVV